MPDPVRGKRLGKEKLMRETVMAEKGPKPAGPYSHAVVANGFVFPTASRSYRVRAPRTQRRAPYPTPSRSRFARP
jgi:hypothetical protein